MRNIAMYIPDEKAQIGKSLDYTDTTAWYESNSAC